MRPTVGFALCGSFCTFRKAIDALRALSKELDLPVAAMLDTKGPEIRLGTFKNGVEKLVTGQICLRALTMH